MGLLDDPITRRFDDDVYVGSLDKVKGRLFRRPTNPAD